MLRSCVIGAVCAAALLSPANASDFYRGESGGLKDPVYEPAPSWTGVYAGLSGGYGFGDSSNFSVRGYPAGGGVYKYAAYKRSFESDGGFGGGQLGYNLQRGRAVIGVEADVQGASVTGSAYEIGPVPGFTPTTPFATRAAVGVNWFGTVRARLGYTFHKTLVYATGGFAFGDVDTNYKYADGLSGSGSIRTTATQNGYAAGAGVEHRISPAWSVKGEYLYVDLGSSDQTNPLPAAAGAPFTSFRGEDNVSVQTIRAGVNYHLHNDYVPLK